MCKVLALLSTLQVEGSTHLQEELSDGLIMQAPRSPGRGASTSGHDFPIRKGKYAKLSVFSFRF